MMKRAVIYIHGMGGSAAEADHYKELFADDNVTGFDYRAQKPWQAAEEFPAYFRKQTETNESVILIANSIGAYFALSSLSDMKFGKVFLISPLIDMERMITDMMAMAKVSEAELEEKKEIPTSFGQTLSWDYLCYVRNHPLNWNTPCHILYGSKDQLIPFETIRSFADHTGSSIKVYEEGEHWFHTEKQMDFLDAWIRENL